MLNNFAAKTVKIECGNFPTPALRSSLRRCAAGLWVLDALLTQPAKLIKFYESNLRWRIEGDDTN